MKLAASTAVLFLLATGGALAAPKAPIGCEWRGGPPEGAKLYCRAADGELAPIDENPNVAIGLDTVERAEAGDAWAMGVLGQFYIVGPDAARDLAQAKHWLVKSAIGGKPSSRAFAEIALMAAPRDAHDPVTVAANRLAAEKLESTAAMFNLGVLYAQGAGVPRDDAASATWFRKAAEQGDAQGAHNLALAYTLGKGVPRDDAKALQWYRRALELDPTQTAAMINLAHMLHEGLGAAKDDAEAVRLLKLVVADKDAPPVAFFNLGLAYHQGWAMPADTVEAQRLLTIAADRGDAPAAFRMARIHATGEDGVPINPAEAFRWCKLAAERGHPEAMFRLAIFYLNGQGTAKNVDEAARWLEAAVLAGNQDAARLKADLLAGK